MKYWITANIKRSPVYETMHISGDCLCGCFAKEEELGLLKMFHPEVYEEIKRIEELRNMLLDGIRTEIPEINVNGDLNNRLCGNLNVNFPGVNGEALIVKLNKLLKLDQQQERLKAP